MSEDQETPTEETPEDATTESLSVGERLETLGNNLRAAFLAAAEADDASSLVNLRANIVGFKEIVAEVANKFDAAIDMRDQGMFGVGFAPEVTRIRKRREDAKPKNVRNLKALDI